MIEITRSDEELIQDDQIDTVQRLGRRVEMLGHKASKAAEDARRPPVYQGQTICRAQVLAAVGVRSGSTVGTGTAYLCILIGTTLYRRYPHMTVPVVNDAGGSTNIAVNTEIWITMVDGKWSVLWEDCSGSPAAFSDQPH